MVATERRKTAAGRVAMIFRQFLKPETGCAAYLIG